MKFLLSPAAYPVMLKVAAQTSDIALVTGKLLGETQIRDDLHEMWDNVCGRATGSEANVQAMKQAPHKLGTAGVNACQQPFERPCFWLIKSIATDMRSVRRPERNPLYTNKYNAN